MLSRRDLIKMGILGTGGFVLLPAGGGFGRVSSFFEQTLSSPRLTPWSDWLPLWSDLPNLTQVPQFSTQPAYALDYFGHATTPNGLEDGTKCFEISAVERKNVVKFHKELPPAPSVWAYVDKNRLPSSDGLITFRVNGNKDRTLNLVGQGSGNGLLIRHHNDLKLAPRDFGHTTLSPHIHGGHQPAEADGFPDEITNRPQDFPTPITIEPGKYFDFMLPLTDVGLFDGFPTQDERPSYLWFHDHIADHTGENVYRGLANIFPVFDKDLDTGEETDPAPALGLPSGEFDMPLLVQDKTFDVDGSLIFDQFNQDGFLGDTELVNGKVQPKTLVKRRKYRLRFLNGAGARIYTLCLTNDLGQTFPTTQIGTEGGLLAYSIPNVGSVTLAPAERVEVVVDFGHPMFYGQQEIYLENRMAQTEGRKPDGVVSSGTKLLKFILTGDPIETREVPKMLRPFNKIPYTDLANAKVRSFKFDRSHGVFTINGEPLDIENSLAMVPKRAGEIWHFENSSGGWWHPIHVHASFQRVIKRNGKLPPLAERDGMARKDTVLLRGGESVDVFLRFEDFKGPFVFHCHNIAHEDDRMMGRFDVVQGYASARSMESHMLKPKALVPAGSALLLLALWLGSPVASAFGSRPSDDGIKGGASARHFPNVRLRTQDNQDVRFYDDLVKGRSVMINFMFTSCTTLCPRSTENLVKVQQALGDRMGRDIFLISVSVDPTHDTPAVLKRYAESFHTGAGWTFVTGRAEDIILIQQKLGKYEKDGDKTQHTGMVIYGNEPTNTWTGIPVTLNPASIARSVLRLVERTSRPRVGHMALPPHRQLGRSALAAARVLTRGYLSSVARGRRTERVVQFSSVRPLTRLNSATLFVTSLSPRLRA